MRDGLCQVLDLVVERPFWDATIDERPGCPRVGVGVLCGVVEEMGGEVEGAGGAQDTDEVGELGVQRGGDEHTLHCCRVFVLR